jgi:hypothetical protein
MPFHGWPAVEVREIYEKITGKERKWCRKSNPAPFSRWLIHVYPIIIIYISLDWFKGKSTGNHGFYHQI